MKTWNRGFCTRDCFCLMLKYFFNVDFLFRQPGIDRVNDRGITVLPYNCSRAPYLGSNISVVYLYRENSAYVVHVYDYWLLMIKYLEIQ